MKLVRYYIIRRKLWGTTITNPTEGALTQLRSVCRFLRILDVCKMRLRVRKIFAERLFKSSYNQLLDSHDSEASHIAKYGCSLICPLIWRHNMYINVHLQSMKRDVRLNSMPKWRCFGCSVYRPHIGTLFCQLITHTVCPQSSLMPTYKLWLATRLYGQ